MRKLLFYLLFIFLFIILIEIGFLVLLPSRSNSSLPSTSREMGRKKTFPLDFKNTPYPGTGVVKTKVEEKLMIFPQPYGRPFYASVGDIELYKTPQYQVFHIKASDDVVAYTVGYFLRWEDVEGSKDKIIILTDPDDKNKTYSYRVAFEPSPLFGEALTAFAVEDTNRVEEKPSKTIEVTKKLLTEIGFTTLSTLVKQDDVVIVTPVFAAPEPNKQDQKGRILASWIIVRRPGGKQALVKELGRSID